MYQSVIERGDPGCSQPQLIASLQVFQTDAICLTVLCERLQGGATFQA